MIAPAGERQNCAAPRLARLPGTGITGDRRASPGSPRATGEEDIHP